MTLREKLLSLLDKAISADAPRLPDAAKRARTALDRIAPGAASKLPKDNIGALVKAADTLISLAEQSPGAFTGSVVSAAPPAPAPSPAQTPAPALTYNAPEPGKGPKAMLENFERSVGLRRQTAEAKDSGPSLDYIRALAEAVVGKSAVESALADVTEGDPEFMEGYKRVEHSTWQREQFLKTHKPKTGGRSDPQKKRALVRLLATVGVSVPGCETPELTHAERCWLDTNPKRVGRAKALAAAFVAGVEGKADPLATDSASRLGREYARTHNPKAQ